MGKARSTTATSSRSRKPEQTSPTPDSLPLDGRRLRSEKSRQRIIAAALTLTTQGISLPSAEAIAEEAGVGLRSVFRHFKDMDGLYSQIDAALIDELHPLLEGKPQASDWRAALETHGEDRWKAFERWLPTFTAIQMQRVTGEAPAGPLHDALRTAFQDVLPAPIRKNRALMEALDLTLSFEAWRRLRIDQGLSPAQARKSLKLLLAALISEV